jgi:hypothetical protein
MSQIVPTTNAADQIASKVVVWHDHEPPKLTQSAIRSRPSFPCSSNRVKMVAVSCGQLADNGDSHEPNSTDHRSHGGGRRQSAESASSAASSAATIAACFTASRLRGRRSGHRGYARPGPAAPRCCRDASVPTRRSRDVDPATNVRPSRRNGHPCGLLGLGADIRGRNMQFTRSPCDELRVAAGFAGCQAILENNPNRSCTIDERSHREPYRLGEARTTTPLQC